MVDHEDKDGFDKKPKRVSKIKNNFRNAVVPTYDYTFHLDVRASSIIIMTIVSNEKKK